MRQNGSNMKIVFMGTPDFALPTLEGLMEAGHQVAAVITQPDKPKGRGYQLLPTPVKKRALELGLPVYQPNTLKSPLPEGQDGPDFRELLAELDPELIVVVAYGKILPNYVLDYPKYGCINVHGSLLPQYRGAAPMQRAIMADEAEVGVTIMYMAEGLDTGDMIKKAAMPMTEEDNFETVHDGLAAIGAKALVEVVAEMESGSIKREKQDDSLATYAAKIEKSDCLLDLTRSAKKLAAIVRGLSPMPLSFCYLGDKMLKIVRAYAEESTTDAAPGTVLALDEKGQGGITVACGEGALRITRVLPEGKGAMAAADFIRGRKIAVGDVLRSEKSAM